MQSRNLRHQTHLLARPAVARCRYKQGIASTYPWIEAQVRMARAGK